MSFILDALKKSENDRQRQSGPALFEVRVAPPRSKFPLLAVVIVSLLVVNVAVVGWVMTRKSAVAAVPPAPATAAAAPVTTQPAITAQPPPAPGPSAPAYAPQGAQQPGTSQLAYNGAPPAAGASGANAPSAPSNGYPPPATSSPSASAQSREPSLTDQAPAPQERLNPDDYAPARDTPPPGTGAGRVIRSTDAGLPTYEEAATRTSIPPLHMDLHSYAADPTKRFVLINMKRLYEGQSLPEGPKVERITNESAIMSYNGTQFILERD
jgi:general secretion pathway protein B